MLYDLKREISAEQSDFAMGERKEKKWTSQDFPNCRRPKKGREEICDTFSSGKVGLCHSSANLSPASL